MTGIHREGPIRGPRRKPEGNPQATGLVGPVPPYVTNANAPQVDYRLAAGFALVVAAAAIPHGDANAAQYTFGTHAQAIHQAEAVKSRIFPAAFSPVLTQVPKFVYAREDNLFQPQPSIFKSAVHSAIAKMVIAAPQLQDLTIQPWLDSPLIVSQGPVPPLVQAAPQADPTQIAPSITPSQPAPTTTNPVATYLTVQPQNEDRPTRQIFPSQVAGQTPPVIKPFFVGPQQVDLTQQGAIFPPAAATVVVSYGFTQVYAAPQVIDLTQQGWIRGTPLAPQGAVPPLTAAAPQTDPTQIPAQIFPSVATPPAITGVTVTPIPPVPPQFDPSPNPSVIWTPSTFSPSAPPTPPKTDFGRRFPSGLAFIPNPNDRDLGQQSGFESFAGARARASGTVEIESYNEHEVALRPTSTSDYGKETYTDLRLHDVVATVLRARSWFDLRPVADQDRVIVITDPTYEAESTKPISDAEVLAAVKFLR